MWWPFNRKKKNDNDYVDEEGNITESAIAYNKYDERFLKLKSEDCAIVLHDDDKVEIVFTKAYDVANQTITPNEETLMALACFMKQPGFLEMIRDEFRKIAMTRIATLTDNLDEKDKK
jgi:hypothetical protein